MVSPVVPQCCDPLNSRRLANNSHPNKKNCFLFRKTDTITLASQRRILLRPVLVKSRFQDGDQFCLVSRLTHEGSATMRCLPKEVSLGCASSVLPLILSGP